MEQNKKYICNVIIHGEICNEGFNKIYLLKRHQLIHESYGKCCQWCHKAKIRPKFVFEDKNNIR